MNRELSLTEEQIYSGNLLLVNADYPLLETCKEPKGQELLAVNGTYPNILLKRDAVNVLQLVLKKLDAAEHIIPVSGYRSAAEQTEIFEQSLKESGEDFTRKFVALPNHSEHQTGLAIDLGLKQEVIDFICPDFPYEGICEQFRMLAPDYGFVERYPLGKEQITGIAHEPWHFRYVGYPHAKIMQEKGLTLEEYVAYIRQFPYQEQHLRMQQGKKEIEIFYLAAKKAGQTEIAIPEQTLYQVSGNNVDGYIVTLWRDRNETE